VSTQSLPLHERTGSSGAAGRASIVEILLGAARIAVVLLATLPWVLASLQRARTAREVSAALDSARDEARRPGLRTVVARDAGQHQPVRFVDLDAMARSIARASRSSALPSWCDRRSS